MTQAANRGHFRARHLALLLGGSLLLVVFLVAANQTFWAGLRWANEPLHSVVEAIGALMAFAIAGLLLRMNRQQVGPSAVSAIVLGLVGMGLLDLAHAIVGVGNLFVWLHSLAAIAGGALFNLVWLPERRLSRHLRPLATCLAIGLLGVASISIGFSESIPVMVEDQSLTAPAQLLNIVGGALFLCAATGFIATFRRTRNSDDLLFVVHCSLFGVAALMIKSSTLWDPAWWGWHLLRFAAYLVALWYTLLTLGDLERRLGETSERLSASHAQLAEFSAELESHLAQRTIQLNYASSDLTSFAFAASHHLQEPLRMISGFLALLREETAGKLGPEAREYIDFAVDGASRMSELIRDLLQYARVPAQTRPHTAVSLAEVVFEARQHLQSVIDESQAEVIVSELPNVQGDRLQLRHVFENLISNALKYCNGGRPRVEIGARPDDAGRRVIAVADNGIGIDPKYQTSIFELFKRLHTLATHRGSGIGLALCKRIVEYHRGEIWVESAPGQGATFLISLPPAAETSPAAGPSE